MRPRRHDVEKVNEQVAEKPARKIHHHIQENIFRHRSFLEISS
jgi:hypothetical protein